MMCVLGKALLRASAAGFALILGASQASAHVKWFCAFDVAGQPRNLENVLCANFELLVGAAMLASYMPASRAAGLNPVEALRGD